ncbi:MAG: aminoacyl-tRNA hydrolase [Caldimicrobium sp.]
MWIFCGLGNPGEKYEYTRHNFGFLVISALAEKHHLLFRYEPALESEIAAYKSQALLVKPMTYMNLSGRAVNKILKEYKITPENLLVIYDDLDLPLGRIKMLPKGGSGGHKGVQSIIDSLGTEDFPRLKLGIGRPQRGSDVKDYVLTPFSEEEWPLVHKIIERAVNILEELLYLGLTKTMTKVNSLKGIIL